MKLLIDPGDVVSEALRLPHQAVHLVDGAGNLLQCRVRKREKVAGFVLQHLDELLDLGDLIVDLL